MSNSQPSRLVLQSILIACLATGLSAHAATPVDSPSAEAAEVSPLAAAAAQSYADTSQAALKQMLAVMVAYGKDQKNMQKAMDLMVAVKSFEATTAAEYERASSIVGDLKTIAEPMNAFRADQQELAGRLMRAELSEWDGILANTARLEAALRSAAKPVVGT
jgi:hypothetical protein